MNEVANLGGQLAAQVVVGEAQENDAPGVVGFDAMPIPYRAVG